MFTSLVDEFGKGQLDAEAHGFTPMLLAARMGKGDVIRASLSYDRSYSGSGAFGHSTICTYGRVSTPTSLRSG